MSASLRETPRRELMTETKLGERTYKVSVSNLQRFIDAISNFSRRGLPGTVAQLTVANLLAGCSIPPSLRCAGGQVEPRTESCGQC